MMIFCLLHNLPFTPLRKMYQLRFSSEHIDCFGTSALAALPLPLYRSFTAVICLLITAACSTAPAPTAEIVPTVQDETLLGSCTLALSPTISDEEAIQQVLQAEGELVVTQEIDQLMQLWNTGASVVDAKHTEVDTADDQQWIDKDAIRHRYVRTVFPGAPTVVSPKDLTITLNGSEATVTATTQIGKEISPGGDRWNLSKQGDCWRIDRLTYNLEHK